MTDGQAATRKHPPENSNAGHRKRLRERFRKSGLDGFHDHEILELLLSYAIPRIDVKPLAKDLLNKFGKNLSAVLDAPVAALERCEGVGPNAAVLIGLVPRLLGAYQQSRWEREESFNSTGAAVSYLCARLGTERKEVFSILALDSRNRLIAWEPVQHGSVNRTPVFPRSVVEASLKLGATAVILAHNHPGGDPQPSTADRLLTRKLKKILNELDIVVHDHIIIAGPNQHYSFSQNGEME
jgi:DNA repair protein RadC